MAAANYVTGSECTNTSGYWHTLYSRAKAVSPAGRCQCVSVCCPRLLYQDMLVLTHQRAKVCLRMDQPLAALQLLSQAAGKHPADINLLLGQAHIQEAVGQHAHALALYQQVRQRTHTQPSFA